MTPPSSSSELSRRTVLGGLGASLVLPGCGDSGADALLELSRKILPDVEVAWRDHLSLQQEHLSRLRLRLAPKQLPGSLTLKLVLRDQLDRDWIFKLGQHALDGATAYSKLAALTGVTTPFCAPATLPINGAAQAGQIQPLVENLGTLRELFPLSAFPADRLTPRAWDDLVRNHALSWIGLNHHVHVNQFLLTGTTERVEGVMRIDNAVAWHLLGQDALTIDYHCPSLGLKLPRWILGYRWFWARHMLGTLDLDLRRAAAWVGWVSRLPTRLVREIFSTGVLNDFERFANIDNTELDQVVPEVFSRARKVGFLNRLCRRFEQSGDELFSFYQKVQATRADELTRPEPSQVLESALDHLHGLRQANDELSALVASLDPSGPQQSISAVLSVDSYDVLREALNGNTLPEDDAARHAIYADAIERLEPLLDTADNACELQAIESSLAEVQRRVLLPYEQAKLMENSSKLNRRHFARLYPILPCAEGEARR